MKPFARDQIRIEKFTMKRFLVMTLRLVVCVVWAGSSSPRADDDFRPLFNGKDLAGWVRVNVAPETFTVRDGMIVSTGKPTGVMRTDRPYENFVMELEGGGTFKALLGATRGCLSGAMRCRRLECPLHVHSRCRSWTGMRLRTTRATATYSESGARR